MNTTILRLNASSDLLTCAQMMAGSNPWKALNFSIDQCLRTLSHKEVEVFGVTGADELLGFLAVLPNGIGFEPLMEFLCIRDDHRRSGLGSALIAYFEEHLFPEAANLYLFVSDINPDAARLYRRHGYAQVGALPDFNLPMQTEFLYRKTRRPRQMQQPANRERHDG